MGKTFHSAQKDMAERVRQIERQVSQIQQRENRKAQELTIPADLWLQSGLEEGGILIIQPDPEIRRRLARILRRRGHKFQAVEGDQQALVAFRKANFSLMIVRWGIFQKSSDLVSLLRKSFPRTRIIITSPSFAWPNENFAGAQLGMEALQAGAYAYIPEQNIRRNIITCIETTLSSNARACPVLLSGLACNQRCIV